MKPVRIIDVCGTAVAVTLCLVTSSGVVFGQDGQADSPSWQDAAESGGVAELREAPPPSAAIVASVDDPMLRLLLEEVLERSPQVAALAAESQAAAQRTLQEKPLPDPVVSLTAWVLPPQTRVGPQLASLGLSQRFPWFGKLGLKEEEALAGAAAAEARVEVSRLKVVTEVRRLAYELAFLAAERREVEADRATLSHYEELARARYASGVGIGQGVVKIQAEITSDDARLLEIATRRTALSARINALRDRPTRTPIPSFAIPTATAAGLDPAQLRAEALRRRPELAEADALIVRAERVGDSAAKGYSPDITAGINYAYVAKRRDQAGIDLPPENNGQDVLGIFASVNLPIHRKKLDAGVEEAAQWRLAAEEHRRAVVTEIEGDLGDLTSRLDLTWDRIRLFEDVLIHQAAESLRSAESAYATGTYNALDLLDAERILLGVRVATKRARTDFAVATAELEGVVGGPITAGQKEIDR
jgi:outer membrane protein TolC